MAQGDKGLDISKEITFQPDMDRKVRYGEISGGSSLVVDPEKLQGQEQGKSFLIVIQVYGEHFPDPGKPVFHSIVMNMENFGSFSEVPVILTDREKGFKKIRVVVPVVILQGFQVGLVKFCTFRGF